MPLPQTTPHLVARMFDDDQFTRAKTVHAYTKTEPYAKGVTGEVTVGIFKSQDDEDKGGVVLRITGTSPSSDAFLPFAKIVEGGIELHMAGEAEGRALLKVLREAIGEMLVVTELLRTNQPAP